MAIRLDFSKAKRSSVEPGVYTASITEHEEKEGKKYPYHKYTFEIQDGEAEGQKMWSNLSESPDAAWKFAELIEACGVEIDWEDKDALEEFEFDPEDLVGQVVLITVDVDPTDEQERTQIVKFEKKPVRRAGGGKVRK